MLPSPFVRLMPAARIPRVSRRGVVLLAAALGLAPAALPAQTVEDGIMMGRRELCTGLLFTHDHWDRYWEGGLKRSNGNVGTVTTRSLTWMGNYGVTERLNVIAMLPHVWTGASAGTSRGLRGLQDVTLAVKLNVLETAFTSRASLRAMLLGTISAPTTDYTPDYLPLSIGSASRRAAARVTLKLQTPQGWFVHGSAAYTWRDQVRLDRPAYYTDGRLTLSDRVAMPGVFDYTVSAGYLKGGLQAPLSFSQVRTQGGGDIRRQDMPFVSNRMNQSRIEALVMWALPPAKDLSLRVAAAYTLDGRNVGQSTTFTVGLLYLFHF